MRRRRLKKATPAGPKKEAPGVKFDPPRGSNFASWGVPNGLLETSWGVLGARSASGGRSGREKGSWKIVWRALGTVLGSSWRLLGQFRVAFPPLGPGRLRKVIFGGIGGPFWRYFGRPGREAENDHFSSVFMFVRVLSLFNLLSSVAFLAAWPAAPRTCEHLENPLVFVGRKPYAPFSRSARSNRISEDTRSQH